MEWLLILSALLNAATGGFAGMRGPDSAPRHEAAIEAVAVAKSVSVAVVAAVGRPTSAGWAPVRNLDFSRTAQVVAFRLPLETDRLIE